MTAEDDLREAVSGMYQTIQQMGSMRARPMFGSAFGSGEFLLASTILVEQELHSVRYFVLHALSGCPIAVGVSKEAAISQARMTLTGPSRDRLIRCILSVHRDALALKAQREEAAHREAQEFIRAARQNQPKAASIPKRRKQIYEASDGKCHYCSTPLTLDGRWHIEHKMPKALMGGNEPSNLVASCAPCNHKKRDRTDQEFIASRNAP